MPPHHHRHRRRISKIVPQRVQSRANQRESGITGGVGLAGDSHGHGGFGHRRFVMVRMTRQHLDGGAVTVAGGEIHVPIARDATQAGFDQAGRFKKIGPIHF